MEAEIKTYQEKLEALIKEKTYGQHPENLYEPIRYIMQLGGKRMRPLLALLAYGLYERNPEAVMEPAISLELFHNFTLLHDDIMDEAPLRRGKPTVHEKWNVPIGILSGDVMLVKVYQQLLDHIPAPKLARVLRLFNQCAIEVCEGQQVDMNFESREVVLEEEYLDMIRQKTAVLLGFSLQLGALLANASIPDQQTIYDIGVKAGIGFQLQDDYLDVYADPKKFGKQVGGDIIANKKTFLLIKAMEMAEGPEKKELEYWLRAKDFDKDEKIQAVMHIYDALDVPALAIARMNDYFEQAMNQLTLLKVTPEGRKPLVSFLQYLMDREK